MIEKIKYKYEKLSETYGGLERGVGYVFLETSFGLSKSPTSRMDEIIQSNILYFSNTSIKLIIKSCPLHIKKFLVLHNIAKTLTLKERSQDNLILSLDSLVPTSYCNTFQSCS